MSENPIASNVTALSREIHAYSRDKGFWDHEVISHDRLSVQNPSIVPEKLALATSEISEALDALRKSPPDMENFHEEIADTIIRLLDLSGYYGYDIGGKIIEKHHINLKRPYKHGKSF